MQAKINLELKHRCDDFAPIRKVLKELGAKKVTMKKQKDYFFHLPKSTSKVEPRMKLRIEDKNQTLVYYERPDFSAKKSTAAKILLYPVKDKNLLIYLQGSLGVKAIVEKKRELWRKGHTIFNLDTVKGVGNIFEIELQKHEKISTRDKNLFKQYQNAVKPYLGKVVKGSNVDLVLKK